MASRILFNNGLEIDQAISGAYPNIITRGSGFVRDTGVQNISGVKYFYDRITFYSGINVTGDFSILGSVVGDFYPKTNNAYDLGTSVLEWKNLYLDGTGRIDSLFVDENATIATGLSVGGNAVTSGNSSTVGYSTASSFMSSGSGAFGRLFVSGTGIPASSTSVGVYGEIIVGSGHLFACTGTNLWGRIALTGWNP